MEMIETIRDSIQSVRKHIEILQATGDAGQDLLRATDEEIEDQKRIEDDPTLGKNITRLFETRLPTHWTVTTPTPPLPRTESHLFQFFLDGSVHGRALGTGLEHTRSFPLGLFQIGAAAVRRDDQGHLFPFALQHRALVTIPAGAEGISDTAWTRMAADMKQDAFCQLIKIDARTRGNAGRRKDADDMRLSSSAVAYGHMHNLEVDLCERVENAMHPGARAIIDGSVQFGRFIHNPLVIGVAKSFWTMPALQLDGGRRTRLNLMQHLAHLPVGHRTAVFEAHNGDVGFWYVRLRQARSHHLQGVVKVELPRPQAEACVETDEADVLSRALVAERTVTPFGIDKRWPSLLYPIHHAEKLIKHGFVSETRLDYLIQSIINSMNV